MMSVNKKWDYMAPGYAKVFDKLYNDNRVREEVIKVGDFDDVLINIIDNKPEDDIVDYQYAVYVLVIMDMAGYHTGKSMISDTTYYRNYYGSQINCYDSLEYVDTQQKDDKAVITFKVVRQYNDFIKTIKLFDVKYDNPDSVVNAKLLIKEDNTDDVVLWNRDYKVFDDISINDRYITVLHVPSTIYLELTMPVSELHHWSDVKSSVEHMIISMNIRKMDFIQQKAFRI